MTWEQYTRYFDNPEDIVDELLSEFQEEIPKMNPEDRKNLSLDIIKNLMGNRIIKNPKKEDSTSIPEFHIPMGYLMHHLHQQYSEIMAMPARLVFLFNSDLDIFV